MTQPDWWRGAALYQIYPRSFADSNNDGIGDLPGVTAKLDYIAQLGVDGVWLSPFYASPMKDFGYDIANYCAVDAIFGDLSDFQQLVARAHELRLKVIVDQVFCHTSDLHPWFSESRSARNGAKSDWYVWADPKQDGSPPNNWQSVFGGPAWRWDARRGQYYMHNFLPEQPQLNLHNADVQDALLDVARFWLNLGVDGFRLDAINFAMHDATLTDNPPNPVPGKRTRPFDFQLHQFNQSQPGIVPFLERLRNVMNEFGPDKFAVAEVVNSLAEMKAFTAGPSRLQTAYGFDFLYADAMTPLVFANAMANWPSAPNEDAPGEGWPSWAFSNHDAPRVASRWSGTRDTDQTARFAMLMLIALRGNIFVYQGEELGLPQADVPFERLQDPEAIANWPLTLGRDGARTPMPWNDAAPHAGFSAAEPWLPVPEDHRRRAVNVQEKDPASMLNWTRQLLALRKAEPALRLGDLKWIEDANLAAQSLVAFDRVHEGRTLRCVFNVGVERAVFSGVAERMLTSVGDVGADYLAPLSGFIAERAD